MIAGNVGTAAGAKALAEAGADAVKVGIGPDLFVQHVLLQVQVYRKLLQSWKHTAVLKQKNIPLIADGGIRYTGDMVKALAAGADV